MESNPKLAIIFIGPPGSGKDTQAEFLARELGLEVIKTSHIIEDKLAQADPDDKFMQDQKRIKDSGQLNDPHTVSEWVSETIQKKSGKGLIFSGSPRTMQEAEVLFPVLEKIYSKDGVKIIYVNINEEETVKRNSMRRVCQANGHPIWPTKENQNITACPEDGSPIITRADDTPETARNRYKIYISETAPILDFLTQKGYNVITIDGEHPIEDVHRSILNKLW